jgi:hypothetical protein
MAYPWGQSKPRGLHSGVPYHIQGLLHRFSPTRLFPPMPLPLMACLTLALHPQGLFPVALPSPLHVAYHGLETPGLLLPWVRSPKPLKYWHCSQEAWPPTRDMLYHGISLLSVSPSEWTYWTLEDKFIFNMAQYIQK